MWEYLRQSLVSLAIFVMVCVIAVTGVVLVASVMELMS